MDEGETEIKDIDNDMLNSDWMIGKKQEEDGNIK